MVFILPDSNLCKTCESKKFLESSKDEWEGIALVLLELKFDNIVGERRNNTGKLSGRGFKFVT